MKSRPSTSSDSVQFANSPGVGKAKSRPGTFAGSIADLMPGLLGVHSRTLAQASLVRSEEADGEFALGVVGSERGERLGSLGELVAGVDGDTKPVGEESPE